MQSWVRRASRAGSFAGGCILLFATGASSSAFAQGFYAGSFNSGIFPAPTVDVTDTRDFSITPMVGLQETFTDNARLTPTNKEYDFITRPIVGADVNVQGGSFTGTATGHMYYDAYARDGSLSGWSADAQAIGSYNLVPNFLAIDVNGVLTNSNVSTFGRSAIDRVGIANRVQVANYDIGPRLTTTIDDFADVSVIGRFAQIFFGNPNASTVKVPTNSTILEGVASIDTADRFAGYQSITSAVVEKDDHDFQGYTAQQSFFVRIFPQVRLVARGGYDSDTQPGIVNINAPMWSGGVEVTINQQSKITIERGERFNHVAWAADLHLQLADSLYAEGRYFEAVQPDQIQINSAFVNFIAPTTPIPVQLAGNGFAINGNLDNQTSLSKQAELHLVYEWEGQNIDLNAEWNDRLLLLTNEHDRSLTSGLNYSRNIAPDLNFLAGITYYRTFANPFFGASESYSGQLALQYEINPEMRLIGGYAYERQLQLFTGGQSISENIAFAAIGRRF